MSCGGVSEGPRRAVVVIVYLNNVLGSTPSTASLGELLPNKATSTREDSGLDCCAVYGLGLVHAGLRQYHFHEPLASGGIISHTHNIQLSRF